MSNSNTEVNVSVVIQNMANQVSELSVELAVLKASLDTANEKIKQLTQSLRAADSVNADQDEIATEKV